MPETIFDVLLAAAILAVAARALYAAELFTGVVHFIIFGLLVALAWARLGAPDIALAEAAIGAGLTGALLLDAAREIGRGRSPQTHRLSLLVTAAVIPFLAVLAWAVLALPAEPRGLAQIVADQLPTRPVAQPVTAVLLDFRAYDTWLELAVLLLAVLGALALRHTHDLADVEEEPVSRSSPMLSWTVRFLTPAMVLVAGYLLWLGTHGPGGAFQAGAVLGATGVLLFHAGLLPRGMSTGLRLRMPLVGGVLAFLVAAIGPAVAGRAMLTVPVQGGALLILFIEAFAALAIGTTLAAAFLAARPTAVIASEGPMEDGRRTASDGVAK